MSGFAPAAERLLRASRRAPPLLWRQKDPKPLWLWHGPSGALRGSPNPGTTKTARAAYQRFLIKKNTRMESQ